MVGQLLTANVEARSQEGILIWVNLEAELEIKTQVKVVEIREAGGKKESETGKKKSQ